MAQQQYQGPDGTIYEEVPGGGYRVVSPAAPQPQGIVTKQVDPRRPYEAPLAQADLTGKQVSTATDQAQLPYVAPRASAEAQKAQADAEAARLNLEKLRREVLKAPASQNALSNLQRAIDDIKAKYAAGPGKTSGVAGLTDYLPTDANQQFDAAGNAVRGFVGPALGLTGGQLNTEKEAQRAVGPYIPQSSDRDVVIEDKITRLQGLADSMRASIPGLSQDRRNTPPVAGAAAATPPGASPPPGSPPPAGPNTTPTTFAPGGGGGLALGGGGFTSVPDPTRKAAIGILDKMLRSGAPDSQVMSFATNLDADPASVAAALEFRKKNPTYRGAYNVDALGFKKVPVGLVQQGMNAAAQSPLGAAGIGAANAVTGNNLDSLIGMTGGNADVARAGMAGVANANPGMTTLGQLGGGALAAAGLETGLGAGAARLGITRLGPAGIARAGDALYGAVAGAGSADNGGRLGGALTGSVAGVGGGMFGRGVARAGEGALTGIRNEGVQMLRDRGVPMTFGQVVSQSGRLGGMVKGVEDRLSGFPIVGDVINARRREGVEGFNRAAFNEGLAPIGQQAVNQVGEQGVDNARQLVGDAYGDALNGVRVTPDAQFTQEMGAALQQGAAIPRTGPEFQHMVNTRVAPLFNGPNGAVDGREIQDLLQGVRGADFGTDAMGNEASAAFGSIGDAVRGLVGRQEPGALPRLAGADRAYRNTNILADSVGRGMNTDGLFTPAQLGMSARSNAQRFQGKLGAASENRPFFDLQRAGQQVLPSKVPDSGTAGRLAQGALLGGVGLAGGGAGYAAGDTSTGVGTSVAGLVALAAAGSRPAQQALNALMLNRPDTMVRAGQALGRRAPIAGMFGAGAGTALLPSQ